MTNIQLFYRIGMQKNGFGPMTFNLDREANKQLKIIMVQGKEPMLAYGGDSQNKVRGEVRQAFEQIGTDFDREVVIIFQALLVREPGKTTKLGAFKGGGDGYKGSAVVYDDIRLDAALLGSTQPDPYSEGSKTIGDFNSGLVGGAAHELGHAFGLGHDAERPILRQRIGRSLMGRGTHTYGEELRRKSPGTFLSAASAFALSLHPLFTHRDVENVKAELSIVDFKGIPARGGLTLTGRIKGTPKPVGLTAFNDPVSEPLDYDAVGWPAPTKPDGSFRLAIGDLLPGDYILRIRAYCETGKAKRFEYKYQVDRFGRPDVSQLKSAEVTESAESEE